MLVYMTLGLCGVLAALLVRRHDLYDREPVPLMALATLLGAGGMWLAGQVQIEVMARAGPSRHALFALMAGTTEEAAKVSCVVVIGLACARWFKDPMDGVVYGSLAGLGAALEESVAILMTRGGDIALPSQELVRLCGHLVMGGIGGAGVGVWLSGRGDPGSGWRRALAGAVATFALAVWVHVLWDMIAIPAQAAGRVTRWQSAGIVLLMLAGFVAYAGCVAWCGRLSRRKFGGCETRMGWPLSVLVSRRAARVSAGHTP